MNRPENNQKLTKKALIKEHTAEIEQLCRGLAETHDKSGVYTAPENYTQMIMQLEQQQQEISQTLAHIKVLKEEMDKKEGLCKQFNKSLDSCNQKLADTGIPVCTIQRNLLHLS
jgi:kinesin family protein 11